MGTKIAVIAFYILSILAGMATWFITGPFKQTADNTLDTRYALSLSIVYTLMHILTVVLFVAGLRTFKTSLRRAYGWLCAGVIMIAVAQLQTPVAIMLDALWWFTSGAVVVLYIAPNIFIYAGLRHFARMLTVKSRWTQIRYILPLTAALVLLAFLLPVKLSSNAPTLAAAHIFLALPLWQLGMNVVCAYLVWRIRRTMGTAYTAAMQWLFITMLVYTAISIHFVLLSYIGYDTNAYGRSGAYLGVFVVLSTMFVVSGYNFWRISVREHVVADASALDVITYTANLATNTHEIDPLLEDMRFVTAKLTPGNTALTPEDEAALARVYLRLEDYLVNREPLRTFTRADLRQRVSRQFPHAQAGPFWEIIDTPPTPTVHTPPPSTTLAHPSS